MATTHNIPSTFPELDYGPPPVKGVKQSWRSRRASVSASQRPDEQSKDKRRSLRSVASSVLRANKEKKRMPEASGARWPSLSALASYRRGKDAPPAAGTRRSTNATGEPASKDRNRRFSLSRPIRLNLNLARDKKRGESDGSDETDVPDRVETANDVVASNSHDVHAPEQSSGSRSGSPSLEIGEPVQAAKVDTALHDWPAPHASSYVLDSSLALASDLHVSRASSAIVAIPARVNASSDLTGDPLRDTSISIFADDNDDCYAPDYELDFGDRSAIPTQPSIHPARHVRFGPRPLETLNTNEDAYDDGEEPNFEYDSDDSYDDHHGDEALLYSSDDEDLSYDTSAPAFIPSFVPAHNPTNFTREGGVPFTSRTSHFLTDDAPLYAAVFSESPSSYDVAMDFMPLGDVQGEVWEGDEPGGPWDKVDEPWVEERRVWDDTKMEDEVIPAIPPSWTVCDNHAQGNALPIFLEDNMAIDDITVEEDALPAAGDINLAVVSDDTPAVLTRSYPSDLTRSWPLPYIAALDDIATPDFELDTPAAELGDFLVHPGSLDSVSFTSPDNLDFAHPDPLPFAALSSQEIATGHQLVRRARGAVTALDIALVRDACVPEAGSLIPFLPVPSPGHLQAPDVSLSPCLALVRRPTGEALAVAVVNRAADDWDAPPGYVADTDSSAHRPRRPTLTAMPSALLLSVDPLALDEEGAVCVDVNATRDEQAAHYDANGARLPPSLWSQPHPLISHPIAVLALDTPQYLALSPSLGSAATDVDPFELAVTVRATREVAVVMRGQSGGSGVRELCAGVAQVDADVRMADCDMGSEASDIHSITAPPILNLNDALPFPSATCIDALPFFDMTAMDLAACLQAANGERKAVREVERKLPALMEVLLGEEAEVFYGGEGQDAEAIGMGKPLSPPNATVASSSLAPTNLTQAILAPASALESAVLGAARASMAAGSSLPGLVGLSSVGVTAMDASKAETHGLTLDKRELAIDARELVFVDAESGDGPASPLADDERSGPSAQARENLPVAPLGELPLPDMEFASTVVAAVEGLWGGSE